MSKTHKYTNWHRQRITKRIERKFGNRNKCAVHLAEIERYSSAESASVAVYGLTQTKCECSYFNVRLYDFLMEITQGY